MRYKRWWALLVLVLFALTRKYCGSEELRVATFNIEDYPKSPVQEAGAFALISTLGATAIAVQEITEPIRFAAIAKASLGPEWRFVYPPQGPTHRIGVLFDGKKLELLSTRVYRELELGSGNKAAFEARLKPEDGAPLRLIVVHLKAGGDNVDTRARQLKALQAIVKEARRSKDRVVVLGDFNATSDRDRAGIEAVADAAELEWASEDLKCTSYWDRREGCIGTPLDHLLHTGGDDARVRGSCEIDGCARADRCPIYVEHISDHCPVIAELD